MRVFQHPNKTDNWKCPICKTDEDKEVVLVGIIGTEDGYNIEAEQVHLVCLELFWDKEDGLIFASREVRG